MVTRNLTSYVVLKNVDVFYNGYNLKLQSYLKLLLTFMLASYLFRSTTRVDNTDNALNFMVYRQHPPASTTAAGLRDSQNSANQK